MRDKSFFPKMNARRLAFRTDWDYCAKSAKEQGLYLRHRPVSECRAAGRATALLSWLDVDRLQHDTSTIYFLTSNLIQLNRTAVAENKTQK